MAAYLCKNLGLEFFECYSPANDSYRYSLLPPKPLYDFSARLETMGASKRGGQQARPQINFPAFIFLY